MIELTTAPDTEVERVPVFKLDGEEVTMPAKVQAGLVIRYSIKSRDGVLSLKEELEFLGKIFDPETVEKMLDSNMSLVQYKAIANRVIEIAAGIGVEEEPAPGNLKAAS